MIAYADNIPLNEFINYKYIIYKVCEYINTGFGTKEEILGYYASKDLIFTC